MTRRRPCGTTWSKSARPMEARTRAASIWAMDSFSPRTTSLDRATYPRCRVFVDTSFNLTGSKQVTNSGGQGLDLKVVKILAPPALDGIQMMNSSQSALNSYSLYIGWGLERGRLRRPIPPRRAGHRGTSATAAERWGRNWTFNTNYTFVDNPNVYLATAFDRTLFASPLSYNNDVFSLTLRGFRRGFVPIRRRSVDAGRDRNQCQRERILDYDRNAGSGGDQPDNSFFVSMPAQSPVCDRLDSRAVRDGAASPSRDRRFCDPPAPELHLTAAGFQFPADFATRSLVRL